MNVKLKKNANNILKKCSFKAEISAFFCIKNIKINHNYYGDKMINSYDIKIINGKEVLYLYFDFNYEFALSNFKNKKNNIKNIIKKYAKDILFKGTTVVLVCGSLIFGTIDLNDNYNPIIDHHVISITNNIRPKKINRELNNNTELVLNDNVVNENVNTYVNENDNNIDIFEDNNIEIDNNTYVTINRKNGDTLIIELEEYITGVVAAELPAAFNIEALKAQAVIARTYALKSIKYGKTLTDNESTQSYKDNLELQAIWGSNYEFYINKIKDAVNSTKGLTLTYNGDYIEAVYHSTSNGYTEDSVNVWNNYYPYLISVESKYDNLNPSFEVKKEISYSELSNKLGININKDSIFDLSDKSSSGRINTINIDNHVIKGTDFRNKLGLRSTSFEIIKNDNGIIVITHGYGHGVGMSQYGANGYANAGLTFNQILMHYYPGAQLT